MKLSEEQFLELWTEYAPKLRSMCNLRLNNHIHDVDDVISEVSFAFWKAYLSDKMPDNTKAWLYSVANNIINKKYREIYKQRENIVPLSENEHYLAYCSDILSEIEDRELYEIVMKRLKEELTEGEKELMDFIYGKGMRLKDLPPILNTTYDAVKQKHYRLVRKIHKIIKESEN